ncbi:MAG: hypothetical protein CR997_08005 [Acidobacteria bacterium]|nr:MAG: hypothetical protein CR997_08005 [Acidobacteriota bacterium]
MACSLCKGKGYIHRVVDGYDTVTPCSCTRKNKLIESFENAGIPSRYWNQTLQSESPHSANPFQIPFKYKRWALADPSDDHREPFVPWDGTPFRKKSTKTWHSQFQALKKCRNLLQIYLDTFLEGKEHREAMGMLIMGTVGIGKTHLLCALLGDLIYAGVTDVYFTEMTDLMKKLMFSYNPHTEISEEMVLDPLVKCSVLVLDDLGSFASDNTQWIINTLVYIFNKRYNFNKPTLISTNYFDEADSGEMTLTDCIGNRLRSRLREICPEITMTGYDYRASGSKNKK